MLVVEDLTVVDGAGRRVLTQVSLTVTAGQRVGESGSVKTTLGLAALGAVRPGLHHVAGRARLDGAEMFGLPQRAHRRHRRRRVGWLGQDPAGALTPWTLG